MSKVPHSSVKHDWETPPDIYTDLDQSIGFTIDAAASKENALHKKYWTVEDNALEQDWTKEIPFCNPPYGRGKNGAPGFIEKFYDAADSGMLAGAMLVAARVSNKEWHDVIFDRLIGEVETAWAYIGGYHWTGFHDEHDTILFCKGRIVFYVNGKPHKDPKSGKELGAGFPSALLIHDKRNE